MPARHAYLSGNFKPVAKEHELTVCSFVGSIPPELQKGQYVRNGSNPQQSHHFKDQVEPKGADYHWFDGDGMLAGVLFDVAPDGSCLPMFVNKFMLTDVHMAGRSLSAPLIPSISSLLLSRSLFQTIISIVRSVILCLYSGVARLSVANTNVVFHDGRALALCESGKGWEFRLPGLESVGWWAFEGEAEDRGKRGKGLGSKSSRLGQLFHEWTTAHPRVDPRTQDLVLFGSTFFPPFVNYSVIASDGAAKCLSVPIPGISSPKMMHDFSCTPSHTCILDLPLSLSPFNLLKAQPVVRFDQDQPSRFGLFPRLYDGSPESGEVRWFEDKEACCIFHTANAFDTPSSYAGAPPAYNLLACRFRTGFLVSLAGGFVPPEHHLSDSDVCLLTYYRFETSPTSNDITHRFALLSIPFEFPILPPAMCMQDARWLYGCSMEEGGFDARLGGGAKIDCLVKVDTRALIKRGLEGGLELGGVVDHRNMTEILRARGAAIALEDPVRVFRFPKGWYGQEATFVPKRSWRPECPDEDEEIMARRMGDLGREDDGWLITYAFDEATWLDEVTGEINSPEAHSELWIIDASLMGTGLVGSSESSAVVAKIRLPSRVPYGLHGRFFTPDQITSQRPDVPLLKSSVSSKTADDWTASLWDLELESKNAQRNASIEQVYFLGIRLTCLLVWLLMVGQKYIMPMIETRVVLGDSLSAFP